MSDEPFTTETRKPEPLIAWLRKHKEGGVLHPFKVGDRVRRAFGRKSRRAVVGTVMSTYPYGTSRPMISVEWDKGKRSTGCARNYELVTDEPNPARAAQLRSDLTAMLPAAVRPRSER